jgi:hypothetical protein
MSSSISGLITQVTKLEEKANRHLKTIEELDFQAKKMADKIAEGSLNRLHSLRTIQIKTRIIRQRYKEKTYLINHLTEKIKQLKADKMFFTNEDIKGFETALNSNEKELLVDMLNPLFSNLSFLRVIRSQLEDFEIYEKCALLQKQIEKLRVEQ